MFLGLVLIVLRARSHSGANRPDLPIETQMARALLNTYATFFSTGYRA
jgi:hypothetical protein